MEILTEKYILKNIKHCHFEFFRSGIRFFDRRSGNENQ